MIVARLWTGGPELSLDRTSRLSSPVCGRLAAALAAASRAARSRRPTSLKKF
jgi:hypothetical protein